MDGVVEVGKKKFKKNLFVLIGAIIVTGLIFEVGLRVFYPQKMYTPCYDERYAEGPGISFESDDYLGWDLKPDYSNCAYNHDTNKVVWRKHNSQKLRLPYEVGEKDRKRIILLGDSFVYGSFLDDSETLYSRFQEIVGNEYEVIPIGVEGYGTDQEFLMLKDNGLKYDPDMVILFFYQNDFQNTINDIQGYREKPFFVLDKQNNLYLANYPISGKKVEGKPENKPLTETAPLSAFVLRYSHLYSLWYNKKHIMKENLFGKDEPVKAEALQWGVIESWEDEMIYATMLTFDIFKKFKKLSKDEDFEFIIVNIPFRRDIDFSVNEDPGVATSSDITDLNLRESLVKIEVPYISLIDLAEDNFDDFYFKKDSHWSPEGAKLTAEYLYGELNERELL